MNKFIVFSLVAIFGLVAGDTVMALGGGGNGGKGKKSKAAFLFYSTEMQTNGDVTLAFIEVPIDIEVFIFGEEDKFPPTTINDLNASTHLTVEAGAEAVASPKLRKGTYKLYTADAAVLSDGDGVDPNTEIDFSEFVLENDEFELAGEDVEINVGHETLELRVEGEEKKPIEE